MATGFPLIQAESLSIGYGKKRVLSIESLDIQEDKGSILGLKGPNGAGKSSFLKTVLGIHKPQSGSIKLQGIDTRSPAFKALLHRVGYVPQARSPGAIRLTVKELVLSGRYRPGIVFRAKDTEFESTIQSAMAMTGINDLGDRAVQELSGGQYQRVLIARALACKPELILLDEPSAHLDIESHQAIIALIRSLASEKMISMIIVSHDKKILALSHSFLLFKNHSVEYMHA